MKWKRTPSASGLQKFHTFTGNGIIVLLSEKRVQIPHQVSDRKIKVITNILIFLQIK